MQKLLNKPIANLEYYKPQEKPRRYPLELTDNLHICLWSKEGKYKCTIAYWIRDKEGYELKFVGDRPLDSRVDWTKFKMIIKQGQKLADAKFKAEKQC